MLTFCFFWVFLTFIGDWVLTLKLITPALLADFNP